MKTRVLAIVTMSVLAVAIGFGCDDDCTKPPDTGACCLDGVCTVTIEADCGGEWQGKDTACDPNPCPQPGACCALDGSCSVRVEAECIGTWTMDETCDPNPCPQPEGACCALDGSCSTAMEADCEGTWSGATTCDPNPCQQPIGACCQSGVCSVMAPADCTGTWRGANTTCDPDPCINPVELVFVPAGTFTMGDGVSGCGQDEREVTLTHDFYLGKYEVTNGEYVEMLQWAYNQNLVLVATDSSWVTDTESVPLVELKAQYCEITFNSSSGIFGLRVSPSDVAQSAYPTGYDPTNHPVKAVTWYGAASYCDWLSLSQGFSPAYNYGLWSCNGGVPYSAFGYRLPTDAEWEYAAQFDDERIYPWGDEDPSSSLANYDYNVGWTSPVGSYPAAPVALGLFDMAGNVREWCNDWTDCHLGTIPTNDPSGPGPSDCKVWRGGSCRGPADFLRCSTRGSFLSTPDIRSLGLGFRVSRTHFP